MGNLRYLYFAGGCFWGVEEFFSRLNGVVETQVGYANGNTENPAYRDVCAGSTGFAEAVRVKYDPEIISPKTLTEQFFRIINPTSVNRQGNDIGTQYRTGVYYTDASDKTVLENVFIAESKKYKTPLAVELLPLKNYYPAETYHQNYLKHNPGGYCHINFKRLEREDAGERMKI